MRQTGIVFNFSFEKGFGFISVNGRSDASIQRVFFHRRDVELDIVGRQNIPEGSPVSFEIVSGKNGADAAIGVCNLDPALEEIDPEHFDEYGTVLSWNGESGYVRRPSTDGLRFDARHIFSEGQELIQVGTTLHYFARGVHNPDGTAWFADRVSVCEPERDELEQHFLEAEELPVDYPEPVAVAVSAPTSGSVLQPSTRKMTLLEIIKSRKN